MSPEEDNRQFPKPCVVLCVGTMEKVLINVTDNTYNRKNLWNQCGSWSCFESVYIESQEVNNNKRIQQVFSI